ncbi:MAG: diaminopimelate decarboxylase [Proteobacteria bacterium]|nr:diaminopimelate decarboxylase [Pseudomonadota bacterium]MDA1326937.1 diaminopimelate decarboxylase [Pseudomonadota bacterium]
MNHFEYRNGQLFAEDVAVSDIAAAVGTPFYCYSTATLTRHYQVLANALATVGARICYAVKANSNLAVIRTLAQLGAGADVVSEGELRRAIAAGIAPENVVFSGVGKTRGEMDYALSVGVGQFNVESESELETLSQVASARGVDAVVALRVNPDVDANTHDKISTGRKDHKFGIDIDIAPVLYARASRLPHIRALGIAVHIGSQLTSLDPFRAAFNRVAVLTRELRAAGLTVERLDLGGGLGITYRDEVPPHPDDYAAVIAETTAGLNVDITVEPGRLLVGNAGILVTAVILDKITATKRFVIVDAAMNDFIRPTLYNADHRVTPVRTGPAATVLNKADVVGPVCETGDVLARNAALPDLSPNDLLAIESAGAYGAAMSSNYNSRLLIAEVLVKDDKFCVIRPRPSYDALLSLDQMPEWLTH